MCRHTYWPVSTCRCIKGCCHTVPVPNSVGNRAPVRPTALVFRKSGRRRGMQWRLVSFVSDPFSAVKLVRFLNDEQDNKSATNLNQPDKLQLKRHVLKPICYMGFLLFPLCLIFKWWSPFCVSHCAVIKHTDVAEERNASIFRVAELVPVDGGVAVKIKTATPPPPKTLEPLIPTRC